MTSTGNGECLVRERCFPLDYVHSVPLRRFFDLERDNYILITKQRSLGDLAPHCIGFLDTETTGLAGGTGTYVFLIGLGYFSNNSFHIKQYFMRDYPDEQAMLNLFEKDIQPFSAIVSYNGKSYDIPALRTRYVLNRMNTFLEQVQQIDLLHSTRRLWKKELGSCDLASVEAGILGFRRESDIPGAEIPNAYFDFLRTRDIRQIKPIFQHNAMDIVTLVALLIRTAEVFAGRSETAVDVVNLVRTFDQMGQHDLAAAAGARYFESMNPQEVLRLLAHQAQVHKRAGQWGRAETVWHQWINLSHTFDPVPYIELAKLYEHRTRDLEQALKIVQRAEKQYEMLSQLDRIDMPQTALRELQHRKRRILNKISRITSSDNLNGKA